ncbi:Na+/H+ antiporter NhaA [Faecalimicrobium sp. JNUCC 81]
MRLLRTYRKPIKLELFTSLLLILSTILALVMYNSPLKLLYKDIFENTYLFKGFSLHMFINDFLMAIFFLVAGLEIKHEILHGSLSSFKEASFPIIASIGGVVVPALIFIFFNKDTPFLGGFCIPISTDIAFAVGVFLIFSKKLNPSLKVFLLSLAVVDDLISILAIGIVYSIDINTHYLSLAILVFMTLVIANKLFNIQSITYYLLSGLCLWYFIYLSGVHCTISGVLLAITIPTSHSNGISSLEKLQRLLVPINSLLIIPLFAFANTGISLAYNIDLSTSTASTLYKGIILGLCVGKPLGIMIFSYLGDLTGITEKPSNISWFAVFLVSLIAGIGFTMSIFVSEIAFINDFTLINIAKSSILMSSVISILSTYIVITIYDILRKLNNNPKTRLINKYYIS